MSLLAELALPIGFFAGALLAAFVVSRLAGLAWRYRASGPLRHLLANGSSAVVIVTLRLLGGSGLGGWGLGGWGLGGSRLGDLDPWAALGLCLAAQLACLTVDLVRERGGTGERRPFAWARVIEPATLDGGPAAVPPRHSPDGVPRSGIGRGISGLGRAVGRHWRGEYPLWVALWVTGLVAGVVAGILHGLIEVAGGLLLGDGPIRLAATLLVVWTITLVTVGWHAVGVWRSAKRYLADRRSLFWARATKLAVVVGVIGTATEIATIAYPQLVEAGKIAFFGDPDIDDFTVEVTHDGRAVEIAGGIKRGLAREVERALRSAPDAVVLRLHSTGGRVGEAERVFALVRRFELDTYVGQRCLSACTTIFAAGRERWLRRGARLGYHGVTFPGYTAEELRQATSAANEYLLEAGVSPDFVARAGRVPNASMWYPTVAELLAARAVTSLVGDDVLGLRHAGEFSKAAIAARLRHDAPLYATMAERAPDDFVVAVAIVTDGFAARRPDALITRELRLHVHEVTRRYRAGADDAALLASGAAEAELISILRTADRELCYAYGRGVADFAAVVDHLPPDRLPQEQALAERILATTIRRAPVDSTTLAAGRQALREQLSLLFGQDRLALLELEKLDASERRRACDVYVGLFSAVLRLDLRTAAALLRQRFAAR